MGIMVVFSRVGLTAFLFAVAVGAPARTFVIPHVLEAKGSGIASFDTVIQLTYNQSISGKDTGSAKVSLFVYNETGSPMLSGTGQEVCNPCQISMSGSTRKRVIRLEDAIEAAGGFGTDAERSGFAIITVTGPTEGAVNVQALMINPFATPDDHSALDLAAREVRPPPPTDPPVPAARTLVFPHVLETSGRTTERNGSFDTSLFMVYTPGLVDGTAGPGASGEFYLYDETGQPMVSATGSVVCNPCRFELGGSSPRKRTIVMDDLITAQGGFGGQSKFGFGVVVVTGADPDGVQISGAVFNSRPTPTFELSVFGFTPEEVRSPAPRTLVMPHVLETSGSILNASFTFDTTIFMTYTGGLATQPDHGGAQVSLFLFDDAGAPMIGAGSTVCNPCTFPLATQPGAPRRLALRVEDLIQNAGGYGASNTRLGYAIIVVGGRDPDGVNLSSFVVNTHTGPFDVSIFGKPPRSVGGGGGGGGSGGSVTKAFVIPHILERSGSLSRAHTFDTTIFATYTAGLAGTAPSNGVELRLYLYDDASGALFTSALGTPVCNPCTFNLDASARKRTLRMDDLITAAGGFSGPDPVSLSAIVTQHGDIDHLRMLGFVVNSHTGPFDLSVFGFEPQPLEASARVRPPLSIAAGRRASVDITLPTQIGVRYQLQSTDRPGGVWVASGDIDGDGLEQTLTDGIGDELRLYRLRAE